MAATASVHELTVDKEFAGLCPALKPEELSLLEASLERDGCRDPIIVWANHEDTIIDGHNRYRYCKRFGVSFKTKALVLEDRNAVRNWIIDNQLARRNVTEEQKAYLRGQRYITEKRVEGDNQHTMPERVGHNVPPKRTSEVLAEEYKVDEKTIRRDAKYAEAVDAIAKNAGQAAKQSILSGELKATKQEVVQLAALPKEEQKAAIESGSIKEHVRQQAIKGLPDGPTPHQEARESPARRWAASLHKLYVLLNSTRDLGGIAKLAKNWASDARGEYLVELKRIVGELNKWIRILEGEK